MGTLRFGDDLKRDAVHQVVDGGYPVTEVSARLGVSIHSLYKWVRQLGKEPAQYADDDEAAEFRRLKRELARVTEEHDIPKKGHRELRQICKLKFAFVAEHRPSFSGRAMYRCLRVHPSGF